MAKKKTQKTKPGAKGPQPKGGKKALIIVGVMILVLVGLGLQTYMMIRKQAKMTFDMVRVGRVISQGRDVGQGAAAVAFDGDKEDNLFFLEGDGGTPPRLQKFDPMNNSLGVYEPKKPEQLLTGPMDVATDAKGNPHVLLQDGRIQVLDKDLKYQGTIKTGIPGTVALGIDEPGNIYVLSNAANKVCILGPDGKPQSEFGAPGTKSGDLANPSRMRVTPDGQVAVLEALPNGLRCKTFAADHSLRKQFEPKIQNCVPLRLGMNSEGVIIFNDHLGSKGIEIFSLASGKLLGQSQATKDGEKFVSPGAAGGNHWTPSLYVHTVSGLIKCLKPSGDE